MKYIIKGDFYTDDDFSIRIDNFDKEFQSCIQFDRPYYSIFLETNTIYKAQSFLEQLMVSFDVIWTHHYLLPDLYGIVDKMYEALLDKNQDCASDYLSGNYDGTEISLVKVAE